MAPRPAMPTSDAFEAERAFLTRLAYRMLGTVQDAEDAVQDAFVRWQQAGEPRLDEPRAWFTRAVTRLCLDRLRRRRLEAEYPGPWLPEPWAEPASAGSERDDTVSAALLVALHRLSAQERAVFLLHDVFGYAFGEVAAMLELRSDHCRKLAERARRGLRDGRPTGDGDRDAERRLGVAFFRALREGDLEALRSVLHEDVVLHSDGGGRATAVPYPLGGRDRVVRFFDRLYVRTGMIGEVAVEPRDLHAGPAVVVRRAGAVEALFQFTLRDGRIDQVLVQRNPDKLGSLG